MCASVGVVCVWLWWVNIELGKGIEPPKVGVTVGCEPSDRIWVLGTELYMPTLSHLSSTLK